ncbi:MAG TPA: YciI family protein [Gemmatimonadaceae bacterium]|nr:YciI family protein [Gemmatimonadaceae bacterium]
MRFMTLYKPGTEHDMPTEKEIAALGQLIEEMATAGRLITTDGLQPSSKCARVRIDPNGKLTVIDGPFTETKELVGGFAIIEAKSKAEAIEMTKRFLKVMGKGESEIRLMHDTSSFDAASQSPSSKASKKPRGKITARA